MREVGGCVPRPTAFPGAAVEKQESWLLPPAAGALAEARSFKAFLKMQLEGAMTSGLWATLADEPAVRQYGMVSSSHTNRQNY